MLFDGGWSYYCNLGGFGDVGFKFGSTIHLLLGSSLTPRYQNEISQMSQEDSI